MGVFKKLKDVLFDDVEEDVEETESEATREIKEKFERASSTEPRQEINTITEIKIPKDDIPERELVKSEATFNFPIDIDVDSSMARRNVSQDSYNYEPSPRKRNSDYSKSIYNELKKDQKKEEPKKFKPTPIISPVYGILDHNYTKDDIIVKTDIGVKGPDFDSVRKKAYGLQPKDEEVETELPHLKTEKPKVKVPKKEETEELSDIVSLIKEEPLEELEAKLSEDNALENTLETDLFRLIDSMYENKEEEDEQ